MNNKNMKKFWGYHLMADCSNCKRENIKDIKNIKKFINNLVKECKMKKLGKIKIENLQDGDEDLFGYSVVQLIHTSSITCHFMDISGDAYIDIFSCKEFDCEKVISIINKYFLPTKINKHFLIRDSNI
jgi:S-adenosylmethionine/arginine decarboxylase-like enzyme